MKKNTQINIDGELFTIKGSIKNSQINYNIIELEDAYKKPSDRKDRIYYYWLHFIVEHDGWMSIKSYNTNFFTLRGRLEYQGIHYYYEIYPTHNDLYIIEF